MKTQPFNPQPPKEVYKDFKHTPIDKDQVALTAIRDDFPEEGGIYVYYQGVPYPRKGWVTIETIETIDMVKRVTKLVFNNWPILLFKKNIERYITTVDYILNNSYKQYLHGHSHYINERYYCKFAKEFRKLLEVFLTEIKVDIRLAEIFTMILQQDDAYRYRFQDMFSESSKALLIINPRAEIERLMKISIKRDDENVSQKTMVFARLLKNILLIPKVKKAFIKAIVQTDFKNLQLDEADKYYCLRPGYGWMGMTEEQRRAKYFEIHEKIGFPLMTKLV